MKASSILIFIVFFLSFEGKAQSNQSGPINLSQKISTSLDSVGILIQQKKLDEAVILANNCFQNASKASLNLEISRSCLLLSMIHRENANYPEALEFGLRSLKAAENVSEEYTLSATISIIHLYHAWEAWDKVMEYIRLLEGYSYADSSILYGVKKEKYIALSHLNKKTEAIWVLEDLIMTNDISERKHYLRELSQMQRITGNTGGALKTETNLRLLLETNGTPDEKAVCENNIGSLYLDLKEYGFAHVHFENALSYRNDESVVTAEILINLSTALLKEKQSSRAISALDICDGIFAKHPEPRLQSISLALKARVLSSINDMDGALNAANHALAAANEMEDHLLQVEIYTLLASLTLKSGDELIAAEFSRKASYVRLQLEKEKKEDRATNAEKSLAINTKEKLVLASIATSEEARFQLLRKLEQSEKEKELSELIYEKELKEAALLNEKTAREKAIGELELVKAALMDEHLSRTITQMEIERNVEQQKINELNFAHQEREKGIELLKKENSLLESEKKLKEIEMEKEAGKRKVWALIIISLGTILSFMIFGVYNLRKKNRIIRFSNLRVKEANDRLQGQNEEIISSIHYARNFQDTIIPDEATFQSHLRNSFLIYEPLDIVSGDIPFIVRKNNELYIGAIDCIGHGVPAAMLSFMAYYNLTELINETVVLSCGELLTKLHVKLSESLKKRYSNPNFASGIDIGLCKLDLNTSHLQFAGANLPVLIVNADKTERIKGELNSVGDIFYKDQMKFETHERQLLTTDRIFLLSDGFIHQFGGELGRKKFSMKRLTDILQSLHSTPMKNVRQQLIDALRIWKGSVQQTDDIVIIGLELNPS